MIISARRTPEPPTAPQQTRSWSWPRVWAVSLGASALVGLLEATHGYIGFTLADQPGGGFTMPEVEVTWLNLASRALPSWMWMGVIIPAEVWLARRFPLGPGISRRHIAVHVAAGLGFAALFVIGASTLRFSLFVQPVSDTPYWTVVFRYYAIYYNLIFVYYWTIVGVYSALRYHREARMREVEKRQLEVVASEARLEALRRQLHPHFLFNLLNAISGLVLEGNRRDAVHSISDLSQLLRVSFARDQAFVSLGEELEFLDLYVDLHRLRLEDRLRLERYIEPAVLDAAVPTFLLQPLVENAIEHGVALRTDGGTVTVEARARGDLLEITIRNPLPRAAVRRRSLSGVGLANTRERIARSYAGEGSFALWTDGGKAVARVVIPLRLLPREEADWAERSVR